MCTLQIIVPTKYYTTPTDEFREWGVSMVIWANHNMRSAVQAMQDVRQRTNHCTTSSIIITIISHPRMLVVTSSDHTHHL